MTKSKNIAVYQQFKQQPQAAMDTEYGELKICGDYTDYSRLTLQGKMVLCSSYRTPCMSPSTWVAMRTLAYCLHT